MTNPAQKEIKNRNKMNLNNIINDISIVREAIENGDTIDALKMLADIQEDLEIISLTH